ncbi:MAG TPA: ABC transporter substrate-binding protein [Baekduia sp.]|uniref:ABC transporter substrate-binding protein n=1 Tax=Baekduia sp. TaxID=2600305 RepID=UPI002D79C6BA|nr:ABC transporter substrate-binding protein [Baekduia sp.]HET6509980.1 ABC transporter substrate-binding protein [Baekduia sp.]
MSLASTVVLMGGLLVAGCGDDKDSGSSAGASTGASATSTGSGAADTTAAAPAASSSPLTPESSGVGDSEEAASGTPIKVMVTAPIDSPVGTAPGVQANVTAAFNDINAHGGVNGHPLKIVFCNNFNDPNKTAACARQAVSEKVAAVIPYAATQGPSLYPSLEKAGIPVIGALPSTQPDWTSKVAYPISAGISQMTLASGLQLKAHGADSVGGMMIDIPSAHVQESLIKRGAQIAGLKFTTAVYHPATAADVSAQVQKLVSAGAKAITFVDTTAATVAAVKAARQLGGNGMLFQQNAQSLDEGLFSGLGSDGGGLLVTAGLPPETATRQFPGIKLWRDELDAAKQAGVKDTDTKGSSQAAWIAAHALAIAAQKVKGSVTAASLTKALDDTEDMDLLGLLKWTPGQGPKEFPRLNSGTIYFWVAKDGGYVIDPKMPDPVDIFAKAGLR